jgi:hypothetical protein
MVYIAILLFLVLVAVRKVIHILFLLFFRSGWGGMVEAFFGGFGLGGVWREWVEVRKFEQNSLRMPIKISLHCFD